MSKNNTVFAQTFSKGLQILEFLVEKKTTTVTVLARELGLQKSASYRFLNTLRLHGYVEQDDYSNYILTDRIQKLGNGIIPKLEFYTVATRFLNNLTKNRQNNDVSNVGFWNGKEIVYIAQSTHNEYTQFRKGATVPAYCSALGKAILAFLPDAELEAYIQQTTFKKFTEHTTISKERLLDDLELVRKNGYALMNDELCLGLKGIAIPLVQEGGPIKYAISLTQTRYGDMDIFAEKYFSLLQEAGNEMLQYIDLCIFNG